MPPSLNNRLSILDLPDEMLLNIFNKLNMIDGISSTDNQILDRICEKILPRIYHQIDKLTRLNCLSTSIIYLSQISFTPSNIYNTVSIISIFVF